MRLSVQFGGPANTTRGRLFYSVFTEFLFHFAMATEGGILLQQLASLSEQGLYESCGMLVCGIVVTHWPVSACLLSRLCILNLLG